MLHNEKYSAPTHQSGPNPNCPLVDNRCDHCGVSIFAQNPDTQMDEVMTNGQHQERGEPAMLPPPPPYQASGDQTPPSRSVVPAAEGVSSVSRAGDAETQPASCLASSRRNRRRPRRTLRIRITVKFKIGGAKEREKTVTFS